MLLLIFPHFKLLSKYQFLQNNIFKIDTKYTILFLNESKKNIYLYTYIRYEDTKIFSNIFKPKIKKHNWQLQIRNSVMLPFNVNYVDFHSIFVIIDQFISMIKPKIL